MRRTIYWYVVLVPALSSCQNSSEDFEGKYYVPYLKWITDSLLVRGNGTYIQVIRDGKSNRVAYRGESTWLLKDNRIILKDLVLVFDDHPLSDSIDLSSTAITSALPFEKDGGSIIICFDPEGSDSKWKFVKVGGK